MSASDGHPDLRALIRDVPDFPTAGIVFKDITPLLNDSRGFHAAVNAMIDPYQRDHVSVIAGIESRGFIFGAAASSRLGCRFIPVRKPGKLPWKTTRVDYDLEYGKDALELHDDALQPSDRVLIMDDVLATGGTLAATHDLIRKSGASVVGAAILIELSFLGGRDRTNGLDIHSVLRY